ncbi:MAG: SMC-Scp complex subunit ScpB [Nanoarchaeota archaeon]|nr:SMC-Scp complex subunit ScpB [Nanoarchaeota archaeon]MBU1632451.1 SMC-Scp complex subunit ScpB [Nanoarchaeota archaeon]MBU1876331.1 SMC-Scp complex subunit ScpB [Nanoarchaeota archaeon]
MDQKEKKVEAVLFAVGKKITSERVASLCSLEIKETEEIIEKLIKEYSEKDHSLQIIKNEDGWKLTVRDEFVSLVSNIVSSTELEKPLMETLAIIAWRYPIVQSDVIKLKGSGAYEHMRQLEEQGFITKDKFGRTYKIKLTKKFFEYFDLPSEDAKKAFLDQIPLDILNEAEEVNKEADEVERLIELEKNEEVSKSEIEKAMKEIKK